MTPLTLASKSAARASVLSAAGVKFETVGAGVDEGAAKRELLAKGAGPREVADALAELKAVKASHGRAGLVIGADQTLDFNGRLFDKAESLREARERLRMLRGHPHKLHSAVVLAKDGAVVWREVPAATLTMRDFSDDFLEAYLARHGEGLLDPVGCYRLEDDGAQLFARIDGDYFSILGLPLMGLLDQLRRHGALAA
jgi:septum formation protein